MGEIDDLKPLAPSPEAIAEAEALRAQIEVANEYRRRVPLRARIFDSILMATEFAHESAMPLATIGIGPGWRAARVVAERRYAEDPIFYAIVYSAVSSIMADIDLGESESGR
jgi:hypothetical protein